MRGEYGLETLEIALTKVRSGEISKRKAEQIYKVLSKTLTRNLKGLVASLVTKRMQSRVETNDCLGEDQCDFRKGRAQEMQLEHCIRRPMLFGLCKGF